MTNLLKLKADEKNNLKFEVAIQGATEPVTEIRFTMKNDNLLRSYPCTLKNNIVEVAINDLDACDNLDFKDFMLEIFIGNKYFSPVEGKLEIIKPVVIESKMTEVKNDKIKVGVKETVIESKSSKISVSNIVHETQPKISKEKEKEIKEDISDIFHKESIHKKEQIKEDAAIVGKIKNLFEDKEK